MEILNHKKKPFNVCHFQGRSFGAYSMLFKGVSENKLTKPDNLDVITFFNNKNNAMLAIQLDKHNIPYFNGFTNFDKKWDNRLKISSAIDVLKKCTNEIVMLLDANDVLILSFDNIIEKFKSTGKRILFNATSNNYPDVLIDKVRNRDFLGKFRYFNAGCCIGYREDVLTFYKQCKEFMDSNPYNPWNSEQFIVRNIFAKYLENEDYSVDFDYECNIFQTFANTKIEKITTNEDDRYRVF